MSFPFKRFFSYLVLGSFFFQTLWPSVVFARVEVPLGAVWNDDPCGLTFKVNPFKDPVSKKDLVRIEAYANTNEEWKEWVEQISQPAPVTRPSAPPKPRTEERHPERVDDRIKKLLDRVVDIKTFQAVPSAGAQALYNDLTVREEGISWAFGGLAFVLDWKWNIATTGSAGFDMAVKICTRGTVSLDNVSVKQILAKGKMVVVRGTGRIERLDAWATGETRRPGLVRITEGSDQRIGQFFLHEGKAENNGQLRIEEALHQKGDFTNNGSLQMDRNAFVKGGNVFTNTGTVQGEVYTLQSGLIQNQTVGQKTGVLKATQNVTLATRKLEQKGNLEAPGVDLTGVEKIETSPSSLLKAGTLKTHLLHSWTNTGTVETNTWQDTSTPDVFIHNNGTVKARHQASFSARFRNTRGGKADLTGVSFTNLKDRL